MKKALQFLLLGFVIVCLAYGIWGKFFRTSSSNQLAVASEPNISGTDFSQAQETNSTCSSADNGKVVAIYFHGDQRCRTCRTLEAYATEAIQSGFSKEIDTGKLEFQVINFDEKQNKHFTEHYELFASTLIVSKTKCGKEASWKNLKGIWRLKQNKPKFFEYVQGGIKEYLG
jgi:hypothetical protein